MSEYIIQSKLYIILYITTSHKAHIININQINLYII